MVHFYFLKVCNGLESTWLKLGAKNSVSVFHMGKGDPTEPPHSTSQVLRWKSAGVRRQSWVQNPYIPMWDEDILTDGTNNGPYNIHSLF